MSRPRSDKIDDGDSRASSAAPEVYGASLLPSAVPSAAGERPEGASLAEMRALLPLLPPAPASTPTTPLLPSGSEKDQVDSALQAIDREKQMLVGRLQSAIAQLRTARTDAQKRREDMQAEMTAKFGLMWQQTGVPLQSIQTSLPPECQEQVIQRFSLMQLPDLPEPAKAPLVPDSALPLDAYEAGLLNVGRRPKTASAPPLPDVVAEFKAPSTQIATSQPQVSPAKKTAVVSAVAAATVSPYKPPLIVEPTVVDITDYQPRQIYVISISVINVSTRSVRHCISDKSSVVSSQFFHVVPVPAENSTIAPGMRVTHKIMFRPQTLCNYSETFDIIVEEPGAQRLTVPINARLDAPKLTLPSTLVLPPCRSGQYVRQQWNVRNDGRVGRFVFAPEGTEPDEQLFASGDQALALGDGAFTLEPRAFTLQNGGEMTLTATYRPLPGTKDDDLSEIRFCLLCDNQCVMPITVGCLVQSPHVSLIVDDFFVESVGHWLQMGEQNTTNGRTSRKIIVRNENLLVLHYRWEVQCTDQPMPFTILPSSGTLQPGDDTEFEVTFAPAFIRSYRAQLELVIDELVNTPSRNPAIQLQVSGHGVPHTLTIDPPLLALPRRLYCSNGYYARLTLTNTSMSELTIIWSLLAVDHRILEVSVNAEKTIAAGQAMEVSVRLLGKWPGTVDGSLVCSVQHDDSATVVFPLQTEVYLGNALICFDSECIDFGVLPLDTGRTVHVSLLSTFEHELQWSLNSSILESGDNASDAASAMIVYDPPKGTLLPHGRCTVAVTLVPRTSRPLHGVLNCLVAFPKDLVGHTTVSETVEDDKCDSDICLPLPRPHICSSIPYTVQVQTPRLRVVETCVTLADLYARTPTHFSVRLVNETMLDTDYNWFSACADNVQLSFEPERGTVVGGGTTDVKIRILCEAVGKLAPTYAICHVRDMAFNGGHIGLEVQGQCQDLAVTYSLLPAAPNAAQPLMIDFGNDVPLFSRQKVTLLVKNTTAIPAAFSIAFDQHPSARQLRPLSSASSRVRPDAIVPLTDKRYPAEGFRNRATQDAFDAVAAVKRFQEQNVQMLGQRTLGVVFHAEPRQAQLTPYATVALDLTLYSNVIGQYTDRLQVTFDAPWQHCSTAFPVKATITGSPVRFSGLPLIETAPLHDGVLATAAPRLSEAVNPPQWEQYQQLSACLLHFESELASEDSAPQPATSQVSTAERPSSALLVEPLPKPPPQVFTKAIQVQNLTPYELTLQWHAFSWDGLAPDELKQDENVDKQLLAGRLVARTRDRQYGMQVDLGKVFRVHPTETVIHPFKTRTVRIEYDAAVHRSLCADLQQQQEQQDQGNASTDRPPSHKKAAVRQLRTLLRKGIIVAQTAYNGQPWGAAPLPDLAGPTNTFPPAQVPTTKRQLLEWASTSAVKLHVVAEIRRPQPPQRLMTPPSAPAAAEPDTPIQSVADLTAESPQAGPTEPATPAEVGGGSKKKGGSKKINTKIAAVGARSVASPRTPGGKEAAKRSDKKPTGTKATGATATLPQIGKRRDVA
ncbi:hypothetical protein RI367_001236 [Sorochytrium milnesiophthora]